MRSLKYGLSGNERPYFIRESGGTSSKSSAFALSETWGRTCLPSIPGYHPFRSTITLACISGEVMNSTYFLARS